jgi:hypothetical protein
VPRSKFVARLSAAQACAGDDRRRVTTRRAASSGTVLRATARGAPGEDRSALASYGRRTNNDKPDVHGHFRLSTSQERRYIGR